MQLRFDQAERHFDRNLAVKKLTRRDFVNGSAALLGATVTASSQSAPAISAKKESGYPPALTGLRGSTQSSFKVAHALRDGTQFPIDEVKPSENVDLVVVGAGLAGLSAAWFYRRKFPSSRILILDNHDDFGGHATRNEFEINGRKIVSYGGSESLSSPKSALGSDAKKLFAHLGIDLNRFNDEAVFHRSLYPKLGLSRGVFFNRENFGTDKLVSGYPLLLSFNEIPIRSLNARTIEAFVEDCPIGNPAKSGIIELVRGTRDYLARMSKPEKLAHLKSVSYRKFLEADCRLPKEAGDFFQGQLNESIGCGIDCVSASEAMQFGLPGARGLNLDSELQPDLEEPYIHHFPDGNASIARLLVRDLVPAVASGKGMDSIVTAHFDYSKLDQASAFVRIRLNSTVVDVRNSGEGVHISYISNGVLKKTSARRTIVATYSVVAKQIVPDIPLTQKAVMSANVKTPMLYTKVAIRNWTAFKKLGVHDMIAPMLPYSRMKLDYPVSLGQYNFPKSPEEPMCIHMVQVPLAPKSGLTAREQYRIGRLKLLETPYPQLEAEVFAHLDRTLGAAGFHSNRDVEAVTINRWGHGYSYAFGTLDPEYKNSEQIIKRGREKRGNIAFASSDTAWEPYAHSAIAEAARAVEEIS